MRYVASLVAVGAMAALLAACGEADPVAFGGDLDGAWEMTEGTGPEGGLAVIEGHTITFTVDGEQVGGISACNHYGATLHREGDVVRIEVLEHTDMACEPDAMDVEAMYLAALTNVDAASRSGDALTLSGHSTELHFVLVPPAPTADVVDTEWVLESLLEGETASSIVAEATLHMDADGTFTASTGCRDLTGQYVEDDGQIRLSEYAGEGDCAAADLYAQDRHVDSVLGGGFRVSVEGDVLTVTTRDGELGLVYRAG